MKRNHIKILSSLTITGLFLIIAFGSDDSKSSNSSESQPKQKITCFRCYKDLTDTYNRINSHTKNSSGDDIYYCTPCWNVVWKEAQDDAKAQGY